MSYATSTHAQHAALSAAMAREAERKARTDTAPRAVEIGNSSDLAGLGRYLHLSLQPRPVEDDEVETSVEAAAA